MAVNPLFRGIVAQHFPALGHEPSPVLVAIDAICRPGSVRLCSECLAPAKFGNVTCGRSECVASLAQFLNEKEGR